MGDRCYMEIVCRPEDIPVFRAEIGDHFPDETVNDDPPTVIVHEANYAYAEELRRVAEKGVPFLGWHDGGGSYGPERFAATGGKIDYAVTDHNGRVVVPVGENGIIDHSEIAAVFRFMRIEKQAAEALKSGKEQNVTNV